MQYKGKKITLENYWEIFGEYPTDVQDEIRLAIMDETEILKYVAVCGSDDYKLKQIRLALREQMPKQYINTNLTAEVIKYLRYMWQNDIDLKPIEAYLGKLDNQSLLYILSIMKKGVDIREVDFTKFTKDLIPIVALGLSKGYPMQVFEGHTDYPEDYVRILMRGLALNLDIKPFLDKTWDIDVLCHLFRNSKGINLKEFLPCITEKFSLAVISELVDCKAEGLDITKLAYRDADGYPVYNEYQIKMLHKALKSGYRRKDIFDPALSDRQMEALLQEFMIKGKLTVKDIS